MARGKFITIEGGEGVGKSTQIARIRDHLLSCGVDVVMTREPGGTPRAERIRELLLEQNAEPMPALCELLLMFAARSAHVANVIEPALARGDWVVCDRFTDATYAYQGGGRGMNVDQIAALEQLVQGSLRPDLTILLDTPLDVSAARARERNANAASIDRFETERRDFFERVRDAYLERARQEPNRISIVDASGDRDAVSEAINKLLDNVLNTILKDQR
jgi:dTMP kinase